MGDPPVPGVTLERVFAVLQQIQSEQRAQRTNVDDTRALLQGLHDRLRRLDRRLDEFERRMGDLAQRQGEMTDDLETMFKMESMGRNSELERRIGLRFDELTERLADLEHRALTTTAHDPTPT